MNKIGAFSFDSMTDKELYKMVETIMLELSSREERNRKLRKDWIDKHWIAFLSHPNATVHVSGKRTIVAINNRYEGVKIGTTHPIDGDVFNSETGVAVAYAKALGESIPDYI